VYSAIYFVEAILLADELEKRGIEHVHNHFANSAATVGLLASQYLNLPWSFTIHGTSEFDYPAGLLLGDKIRAARFVACVSQFGRAQAQRCVDPKEWNKLFINRCGIDPSVMPERVPRGANDELRIIAVGRLSREKAFPGLIEAFAAVSKRGLRAHLDIIGDGPERSLVEKHIASYGLNDSCKVWGYLSAPEVLREIAKSDILVMSSLMEGLPVVLMEAMALQVAVVAPRVAGIPELVEHERTGLLYTVSDWAELADCLSRLLQDADLRQQLGKQGYKRVLEQHAIDQAVVPIAIRLLGEAEVQRTGAAAGAP
jgi:glycosyltransferase involved in cell wall biosynthesis